MVFQKPWRSLSIGETRRFERSIVMQRRVAQTMGRWEEVPVRVVRDN